MDKKEGNLNQLRAKFYISRRQEDTNINTGLTNQPSEDGNRNNRAEKKKDQLGLLLCGSLFHSLNYEDSHYHVLSKSHVVDMFTISGKGGRRGWRMCPCVVGVSM